MGLCIVVMLGVLYCERKQKGMKFKFTLSKKDLKKKLIGKKAKVKKL